MRLLKTILLAGVFGMALTSCGDSDELAPLVTILTPTSGSTYTVSDPVTLTGTVLEETELASVKITSDLGLDESITTFTSPTSYDLNFVLTLDSTTVAGDYTITVEGEDTEGNKGSDSVDITVQ